MFIKGAKVINDISDVAATAAAPATTFPDILSLCLSETYKSFHYKIKLTFTSTIFSGL
jgi:hypothetical protein